MLEICQIEQCTGCMACFSVCPHHAVEMKANEEGFLYPVIDNKLCISCGLCIRTCPTNNPPELYAPLNVYSGWSKNEEIRMESSSGGAFTEIARQILQKKGVVFGVRMDEKFHAVHCFVENIEELSSIRGSKYIQSNIKDSYIRVKTFLKEGRWVLFSGTPCQIAGLNNFLKRKYENLVTVDLICHGIPSPLIWDNYLQYQKEKLKINNFTDIKFRCKRISWFFYSISLSGQTKKDMQNVKYYGEYNKDPFIRGFLRDWFLRPSCYSCQFSTNYRCSDFTIADWWFYHPDKGESWDFEKKGVSLILCNTTYSQQLFKNRIAENMIYKVRDLDEACKINPNLIRPTPKPVKRNEFWFDYKKMDFEELVKKYMYPQQFTLSTWILTHFVGSNAFIVRFTLRVVYKLERIWNNLKR